MCLEFCLLISPECTACGMWVEGSIQVFFINLIDFFFNFFNLNVSKDYKLKLAGSKKN